MWVLLVKGLVQMRLFCSSWSCAVPQGRFGVSARNITMSMLTNLAGRLRNTSLPLTNGLLPLFEAVVNSIHSIDQGNKRLDHPAIIVSILRKPKQ